MQLEDAFRCAISVNVCIIAAIRSLVNWRPTLEVITFWSGHLENALKIANQILEVGVKPNFDCYGARLATFGMFWHLH